MIPKIIHYCWLSKEPYPPLIKECMATWKRYLPDYEFCLWDTERFDIHSTLWTKQTFETGKYAFAADYIRLYALYNYGGIYLDSDVIIYKSFNDLLSLPYFIGQDYTRAFEAAVIGAEKGTKWIGDILLRYDNRPFIKENGGYDVTPLPQIFYHCLNNKYKFYKLHRVEYYQFAPTYIYVFDNDFFNSRNSIGVRQTKKSFCAHNYAGSWTKKEPTIKNRIKRILPKWLLNIYFTIAHHTFNKKRIGKFEPVFEKINI